MKPSAVTSIPGRMSRTELRLESVAPGEILSELMETYPHFKPPQANITVSGPLPGVKASKSALTQCIANLLGNSVKFVAPGVIPEIRVRAEASDQTVRLWFEDNGIGIAPQFHEKIWSMLERLNASYEGAGVGLSIVRKAVERMGGNVGVQSEVGRGARF